MNTIQSNYGVDSSYSTVWRAFNDNKKLDSMEYDESYMLIKDYLDKLVSLNPGTVTSMEFEEVGVTFKRSFLCPRSNQTAYRFCRPMVILDACHSRSQYGGVILSACAHDGEGRLVPLAMELAEIENENHWLYFIMMLSTAIPEINEEGMVVMHDREKGLHNAQLAVLQRTHESICFFHSEKNVNSRFKSKFQGKIWAAAKAYNKPDFQKE
jgi:MULE transposase domain